MKKKPRFFCDNCNSEVGQDAKVCPRCGRFFASVRCPSCGFTGEDSVFKGGCPSCGYSAPPAMKTPVDHPPDKLVPAGKLPLWVYILSIFAFISIIAVLIYRLI
jgi:hypothetical protein